MADGFAQTFTGDLKIDGLPTLLRQLRDLRKVVVGADNAFKKLAGGSKDDLEKLPSLTERWAQSFTHVRNGLNRVRSAVRSVYSDFRRLVQFARRGFALFGRAAADDRIRTSFQGLFGDQGGRLLGTARNATQGFVSDMRLRRTAVDLFVNGLEVAAPKIESFFGGVTQLAASKGVNPGVALERIAKAVRTLNTRGLHTIGIPAFSVADALKKVAENTGRAVAEIGELERRGIIFDTLHGHVLRLNKATGDTGSKIAAVFDTSKTAWENAVETFHRAIGESKSMQEAVINLSGAFANALPTMAKFLDLLASILGNAKALGVVFGGLAGAKIGFGVGAALSPIPGLQLAPLIGTLAGGTIGAIGGGLTGASIEGDSRRLGRDVALRTGEVISINQRAFVEGYQDELDQQFSSADRDVPPSFAGLYR